MGHRMSEITGTRAAAASILRSVSRGQRLDLAFQRAVSGMSSRDRRFVQEITYGTVRLRGRLDHLLDQHLRKGLESVSTEVLNLLRLGAYQLLCLDGVPDYAAVSQTVDQVREVAGKGASRMANGILRNLDREGAGLERFPDFRREPESHLSSWGSHPSWLIRRWLRRWSPDEVRTLVEFNNTPPPLFFRPLESGPAAAAGMLVQLGFEVTEMEEGIPCLNLGFGTDPARVLAELKGLIQDPGAALVTVYGDMASRSPVGDLCAAPGGKTLALAGEGAYVLAGDRSLRRLQLLRENVERVGGRIDMVAALAQAPPFRSLPGLLLDVPCSGTGTLRRHPDARWRITEALLEHLAAVQREMLEAGSRIVDQGGVLVYSTCSLEPEENEDQVTWFLKANPEFVLENSGTVGGRFLDEAGCLSVFPQTSGFDGAFAARLVRRA